VEKSPVKQPVPQPHEKSEALIYRNGALVEDLLKSEVWTAIGDVLLSEGIASVSGRRTNGRWFHGEMTRGNGNLEYLKGYQCALMEFSNRLLDFVNAKDNLKKKKQEAESEKRQPLINPFLDDEFGEN
jgi:hypothetical protein